MQLIAAAEGERRGLYGGAVGYLGYDGNMDTAITIRSAVLREGRAHVHTGAGIVAGSVPGEGVRGDRAQGRGPPPGDRGRRRAGAATPSRPPRLRGRRGAPMILVIDNYDSFTFNLVQALQAAGADVRVVRNDAIDRAGIEALAADRRRTSTGSSSRPGPGDPDDAGVSMDAVRVAGERSIPLLGVCLGMQSMARSMGLRSCGRRRSSTARRRR